MMRLVAARLAQIFGVHLLEQRVLVALADGLRVILAYSAAARRPFRSVKLRTLAGCVGWPPPFTQPPGHAMNSMKS